METNEPLDNLIRRCQRGEQQAFEAVFVQYQPRLRFYVRRLASSFDHTDDLLQDIWVKVIRKVKTLREPKAFTAWLYKIARNEVISKARLKDPWVGLSNEHLDAFASEDEPDFSNEDAARVHQGLDRLKAPQKEILTLFFLEQMPYKDIAQVLDIHLGTVRSRLFHAKHSLRKELEKSHE
ncbi:MAG: sigma-70 family RNA polymerase sigma factor [Phycisphaeraceae bacterium]|nr:sigma-70 family RNA polymerase sigma factor [Phycisphaeraceae bacterium]